MVNLIFNLTCEKCEKHSQYDSGVPEEYIIDLDGLKCIHCHSVNLFFPEEVQGDFELLGNGSFEEYAAKQLTIKETHT